MSEIHPDQAAFLTPLRSEDEDGRSWKLLEPLRYYSKILDRVIELPAGFVADSYSAPYDFVGSWIVRGLDRRPAFVHDKLYSERATTRKQADDVLLEAMESVGISWWRRQAIYRAVRLGGAMYWSDEESEAPAPQDNSPGG